MSLFIYNFNLIFIYFKIYIYIIDYRFLLENITKHSSTYNFNRMKGGNWNFTVMQKLSVQMKCSLLRLFCT